MTYSIFIVSMLYITICLTQAAVLNNQHLSNDVRLDFDVIADGKLTEENIEMNYDENYVRIMTPETDDVQSMVMVHDYTQDLTLFKTNGRCFLMNEYKDIPEHMDDWLKLEENTEGGPLDAGGKNDLRAHLYKLVPFAINTTTLPPVMRRECSGDVEVIVLEETVRGRAAYNRIVRHEESRPVMKGVVYLPPTCSKQDRRVRRAAAYCGGCRQCRIAIHTTSEQ